MIWLAIGALALGTLALKGIGPLLAGGVTPPAPFSRVIDLLTPALLAALVVVTTVGEGRALVIDSRLVGVLAGLILLCLRVPLLLSLVAAAAVTAVAQL